MTRTFPICCFFIGLKLRVLIQVKLLLLLDTSTISNVAENDRWLVRLSSYGFAGRSRSIILSFFFLFSSPVKKIQKLSFSLDNYTLMASKFLFSKLSKPLLGSQRNLMVSKSIEYAGDFEKRPTCFTIYSIVVVSLRQPTCFLHCAKPSCLMDSL